MITTSEFLSYVRKTSTKQVYTSALRTYLSITSSAPQNNRSSTPSLDQRWTAYLRKTKNPWHDMEQFPRKAKEQGLSPKTINLYIEIVQLYLGECNLTLTLLVFEKSN